MYVYYKKWMRDIEQYIDNTKCMYENVFALLNNSNW